MRNFQKIEDKKEWQELLNKTLFRTFFHNLEWEEFLEKNFKWLKFERYLYKRDLLLSFARYRIFGSEHIVSHPFCEYGGPLPLKEKIDFLEFKKDLLREFRVPLKISFHPKLLPFFINIYSELGGRRETFFFEDLDKRRVEEIWRLLDRNRHRAIKKAKGYNFQIEECQSEKELRKVYKFYVENLKKHRALVYPFSFFKFFFQNKNSKILLVKKNSHNFGGNIFLFYQNICHSFLCGFNEKYKKWGIHSFLLWKMIEKAHSEGCSIFDFGGTRKDSSIREFKQRWGAKVFPIFELKNYSEEIKLKDSFLRKIWGCLPTHLIKIFSPYFLKYKL